MHNTVLKLVAALGMLVISGLLFWRHYSNGPGVSEQAFFYDLSERRLFAAPRGSVPPMRGLNNSTEDAVRAVVISTNGNPKDKKAWTISYLETCSPELKHQLEAAQAGGSSPEMGRTAAQKHRLVRRIGDTKWYSLDSPEGEVIVRAWLTAGPGGTPAVVCAP